jgi:hypothetical protein
MGLPVLTAFAIMAFLAVDRWTAAPWSGPTPGTPLIFKIVNGATGKPFLGASFKSFEGANQRFAMVAPSGTIRMFGEMHKASGYQSLVRDTRHLDFGDMNIRVTAEGFDDFEATAADLSQLARLASDGSEVEVVVRLRRHQDRPGNP